MFRIKICGITNLEDSLLVAAAGADAVGLNFFPGSPRRVEAFQARQVAEALPAGVAKVGVFVNAAPEDVCSTFDSLPLDLIQLHGDEPPEFLPALGGRPVMRAFRVGRLGLRPVTDYLKRCRQLGCLPRMILLDASVQGVYGGSGSAADWEVLSKYPIDPEDPPMVLAGGLTPENVARAVRAVGPFAVDTASGLETSPGKKSPELVEAFVREARRALARGRNDWVS